MAKCRCAVSYRGKNAVGKRCPGHRIIGAALEVVGDRSLRCTDCPELAEHVLLPLCVLGRKQVLEVMHTHGRSNHLVRVQGPHEGPELAPFQQVRRNGNRQICGAAPCSGLSPDRCPHCRLPWDCGRQRNEHGGPSWSLHAVRGDAVRSAHSARLPGRPDGCNRHRSGRPTAANVRHQLRAAEQGRSERPNPSPAVASSSPCLHPAPVTLADDGATKRSQPAPAAWPHPSLP